MAGSNSATGGPSYALHPREHKRSTKPLQKLLAITSNFEPIKMDLLCWSLWLTSLENPGLRSPWAPFCVIRWSHLSCHPQLVWKPVLAEDAPLGEYLARGLHLLVHVTSLPDSLRGTFASKSYGPQAGSGMVPLWHVQKLDGGLVCLSSSSRSHRWIWPSGWWCWKSPCLWSSWMRRLSLWPETTWNPVKSVCSLPPNPARCRHAPMAFPGRLCCSLCPWWSGSTAQTLTLAICSGLDWQRYIQKMF